MAWSGRRYNRYHFRHTGEESAGTEGNGDSRICMFDYRNDTVYSYVCCMYRMCGRTGCTVIKNIEIRNRRGRLLRLLL